MASIGLLLDEADDTYMLQYMDTIFHDPLAPDGAKGFAECTHRQGRAIPLLPPWPNMMYFTWSDFHCWWIPQIETVPVEAVTMVVVSSASGTIPPPSVNGPGEPI